MNLQALYNKKSQTLTPSEIGELLKEASGEGFISFAMGAPDPDFFPVAEIANSASLALKEEGKQVLQYGDPQGKLALREHLAQLMSRKYAIEAKPESILLTSGSMQCLELCGRLFLEDGDTVLVESPTFIDAMNSLTFNGAQIEGVAGDDEGMDLALLKEKLESNPTIKLIYVIPDFQNPTGKCWSAARRQAFMNLVAQYNVLVLEDNPYGEINYTNERHAGLASYDQQGQVIFLGSLSKTFSPGIRIGWIAATSEIITKLILVKERCDLHSSLPDHAIAATFMDQYSYDDHIAKMCALYQERRDCMIEGIQTHLPTCKANIPQGGFFIWLQLPTGVDCNDFAVECLRCKIACVPGSSFYPAKDDTSFVRLNFTGVKNEQIEEGVKRLALALEKVQK